MARKAITFKHLNGALKFIPGVANKEDLAPRLIQVTEMTIAGQERTVLKKDESFVAKVYLFDEDTEAQLTEGEKKYSQAVKDSLIARRAEATTLAIQANNEIRDRIRELEKSHDIKVLDWNYEVAEGSGEEKGLAFDQLSDIALADFEDRGITVPEGLRKRTISGASAEKAGVVIKGALKPKVEAKTE